MNRIAAFLLLALAAGMAWAATPAAGSEPVVSVEIKDGVVHTRVCLLYTSPSPRDRTRSRMPSSA